jgi:hypothetical protein
MTEEHGPSGALGGSALAVLVAAVTLLSLGPTGVAHAARPAPAADLLPMGNFALNASGPNGFLDPGSRLTVQYHVQSSTYPSSNGPAQVRVPPTTATFTASTGTTYHAFLAATNFTIDGKLPSASIANGSVRLTSGATFRSTTNATLSSSEFAVMATWAPGSYPVQVQWQWVVTLADGSQTLGPWSAWTTVTPAQLAVLANAPPSTVPLGGNYPVCLTGPIAGREFTVHMSTVAPTETFAGPTVTVPTGFTGNFCWNTTAPSAVASQTVIVHIWELSGGNFLLYQKSLALSNTSGVPPPGGGGAPGGGWPSGLLGPLYFGWFSPLLFGVGVVVVAAVLLATARRRSRRRSAYAAAAAETTTTAPAEGRAPPADSAAYYGPGR